MAVRLVARLLYGLDATDGATVGAGVFVRAATTLLASHIPGNQ